MVWFIRLFFDAGVLVRKTSLFFLIFVFSAALFSYAGSDSLLKKLSDYKKWNLVNARPANMDITALYSCVKLTAPPQRGPHQKKYVSVYVNDIGKHAMMEEKKPIFPVGSAIVKEKLGDYKSKAPELLTIMVKREKGFDPAGGDWEYFLMDGKAKKFIKTDVKSCKKCHAAEVDTDYVKRSFYLSWDDQKKLK